MCLLLVLTSPESSLVYGMSHKTKKSVTVHQMAHTLLKSCLSDVKTNLRMAVKAWRSNNEGVHQLRISLRRTLACLDLFSDEFSAAKETRWLQKRLTELLKSAGKARDLDVLLARDMPEQGKAQVQLRKAWSSKRKECQKPLDRFYDSLVREEKLRTKTRALLKRVNAKNTDGDSGDNPDRRSWSRLQLRLRIESLLKKLPEGSQLKGLHSFRVSAKQLRYVAELLQESYPGRTTKQLLQLLTNVQKNLGRLQDEAVAAKSVARLSSKVSKKQSRSLQSISNEAKLAAESRATELSSWLNNEIVPELNRLGQALDQSVRPATKPVKDRSSIKRKRTVS